MAADHTLLKTAAYLFCKTFNRKARARLIGALLSSLTGHPYQQKDLFYLKNGELWDKFYQGIERIRRKYGFRSTLRATRRETCSSKPAKQVVIAMPNYEFAITSSRCSLVTLEENRLAHK
jgi:hypothetical protein